MKKLWKFYWDCGRQGSVQGLFCATKEEVEKHIGSTCYLGAVLGKHSDIYGTLEDRDLQVVDFVGDQEVISVVCAILGDTWSGFNPLEFCRAECIGCDDDFMKEELIDGMCFSCRDKGSTCLDWTDKDILRSGGDIDG